MSKPEVPPLKHQEALSKLIIQSKRKTVLSLWWLSVPVFMIAAFVMKQLYKPGSSLGASIREFKERHSIQALLLVFFLPLAVVAIQVWQLCRSGPGRQIRWAGRLIAGRLYWLIIIISGIILILYLCN